MQATQTDGGPAAAGPLLELDGVSKRFGGIEAVSGISLWLREGELLCIIGPNGCGKTTLFNLIGGAFPPSTGSIRYRGQDIAGLAPWRIARLGIGRKFQVPGIYPELTVRQNFDVPLFAEAGQRGIRGLFDRSASVADAAELMALVRLDGKADLPAGELAHGEKQWLEIGMAMAGHPRLMLLDEPTAGMTMGETEATADLLRRIHGETGVAVIVIEHDMGFVRRLGCPVAVMMRGAFLCRGSYEEVSANEEVREAYLGERTPC